MEEQNLVHYSGEYVLEEGIERFAFPKKTTFACTLDRKNPHLVEATFIFMSTKRGKKAYIFCPKHRDFFNVAVNERGSR